MAVLVEHLCKSIGSQPILRDISLRITDGEVVGLLGPNGAGKSTLMKCLTGLWQFDSGRVSVAGVSGEKQLPHEVTRYVGYLPENNPLYDDMYVREYLMFMAQMTGIVGHRNRQREVERVIERVGLSEMAHKRVRELSKGYRQRVGLAQAIMGEPQLLILDEPTTGLDPNQLDEIRQLIRTLGKERTVILSTHILQEVSAVCSRVVIIANGEIREDTTCLSNIEQLFRERTK